MSGEFVQLLNMVLIQNERNEVLVLDKVKKEGWEGLTFPGGKVEPSESLVDSARREAWEETGYTIGKMEYAGAIHWISVDTNWHGIGFLYRTSDFSGQLRESREGSLQWMSWEDFLKADVKSGSMKEILAIYQGKAAEVLTWYDGHTCIRVQFCK